MWQFSKHAIQRIKERDYLEEELIQILQEKIPAIVIPSPRDEEVDLYFGEISGKFVLIVVNKKSNTIITVRPMHKNEKTYFLKEFKNE